MAKKKKRITRKKTTARPAKKRAKSASTKPASKKPSRPARKSSAGGSVDLLLKRFAKERAAKESHLELLRKKRDELKEKLRKQKEQIDKLTGQENKAQAEIAQLDARRDQEVSALLSKLGVRLSGKSGSKGHATSHSDGQNAVRDQVTKSFAIGRDELN